ncbi:hypothetical protein SDC9_191663 [bioreactor metagenome]|uniref:Uncharacterized protein n=1 Tax=bioreactor metagenome TaxID=1076179 RepID=A0A645I035_9ZZZZ
MSGIELPRAHVLLHGFAVIGKKCRILPAFEVAPQGGRRRIFFRPVRQIAQIAERHVGPDFWQIFAEGLFATVAAAEPVALTVHLGVGDVAINAAIDQQPALLQQILIPFAAIGQTEL